MNRYLHGDVRLNLLNTYYLPGLYSNAFLTRMAHGYNSEGMDVTADNMSWAYTAGAIVTTTQDLLDWWRNLFQGNLLPPKQLGEMMSLVCEGNSSQDVMPANYATITRNPSRKRLWFRDYSNFITAPIIWERCGGIMGVLQVIKPL